ncbi:MAG: NADH:flavin oxidoreductase [Gammaproteobacteria bacterium]|nr:MAG: NADH:flavin oxidoreductase [Gammaproteobacteria bacterium]RLA15699.1 MAG: NADH:flavin oxidoreductase [Gammaproteobacteria bacterium]
MPAKLTDALTLPCGQIIPNRIMKSAMTEGLADANDHATSRHLNLYRRWSHGGAGLLITGNVMIDRRYLEKAGNVVIENESGLEALQAWAKTGQEGGNQLWMQISHPGRQCAKLNNKQPVSASDVQLHLAGGFGKPRWLESAEIEEIIQRYATTAEIAKKAGFSGVQLHGAHGYLISQFLSPVTNRRTDQWGGPLENRARLLLRSVEATRERVGKGFPISIKLNSADFQKGGFTLDECVQVVTWLNEVGIDLLEISGGSYEAPQLMGFAGDKAKTELPPRQSTLDREAYFLDYTQAIRKVATMPVAVTGGFRSLRVMQDALAAGELDMIGMSRPFAADPELARGLLDGSLQQVPAIEQDKRLGPGFLSQNSRIGIVKMITMQGQVGWFAEQMTRIADNQPPNPDIGILPAMIKMVRTEMKTAKARHFQA